MISYLKKFMMKLQQCSIEFNFPLSLSMHWAFCSFPGHNISSAQIVFLDSNTAREANSRPRGIIQDSRSGFTGQRRSMVPTVPEEDSRLTHEEQKKALTKLKKEIYTPSPKRLARRLGRSYGANTQDALNETGKDRDEDGKRCAICLDDFEPRQEVVLTPCDHMFHEDCIVPWVKSQGQCPVCRSQFGERKSGSSSNLNNSTIPHVAANDLVAGELMSLVRSMEEVFQWGHGPPR